MFFVVVAYAKLNVKQCDTSWTHKIWI